MKTFIVCSDTNYNLMVHVVNADTREEAEQMALDGISAFGGNVPEAWDGCRTYEVDTSKRGIVFCE